MTRVQAGLLLLVAVPILWGLMWWGWRGRVRRHRDMAALPVAPQDFLPDQLEPVEGTYVSTTTEGDWLDRVVAHGLGVRSPVAVSLGAAGLLLARRGAADVWIPATALRGVRKESGMAGKYVGGQGLVVVTWAHAEASLDTGLRLRRADDADRLVENLQVLTGAVS